MRGVDADDEHGDYEDNDNDEYDNDDAEDEDDADAPGKRRLPQGKSCIFCRVIPSGENPHHLTIIVKRLCKHHRYANDNTDITDITNITNMQMTMQKTSGWKFTNCTSS